MNKNKKTLLLVLVFVYCLGGAYILYNQLSGQVARDSIVVTQEAGSISGTQPTQAPEASPGGGRNPGRNGSACQEEAPAAPDFYSAGCGWPGSAPFRYAGHAGGVELLGQLVPPCKSEMPDFGSQQNLRGKWPS